MDKILVEDYESEETYNAMLDYLSQAGEDTGWQPGDFFVTSESRQELLAALRAGAIDWLDEKRNPHGPSLAGVCWDIGYNIMRDQWRDLVRFAIQTSGVNVESFIRDSAAMEWRRRRDILKKQRNWTFGKIGANQ